MISQNVEIRRVRDPWPAKAAFKLIFPLTDKQVEAELKIDKQGNASVRVKEAFFVAASLTANEGPLKTDGMEKDTGLSSNAFVNDRVVPAVRPILATETITGDKFAVLVRKHFKGGSDETGAVAKVWNIGPSITEEITRTAKYVLLRTDGEVCVHNFGWAVVSGSEVRHYAIASEFPGAKLLGGGFFSLGFGSLDLTGESFDFGSPPFEDVHDAAKAIVQVVQSTIPLKTITVEGTVQYEFSVKA